jgi:hypothetical protein
MKAILNSNNYVLGAYAYVSDEEGGYRGLVCSDQLFRLFPQAEGHKIQLRASHRAFKGARRLIPEPGTDILSSIFVRHPSFRNGKAYLVYSLKTFLEEAGIDITKPFYVGVEVVE